MSSRKQRQPLSLFYFNPPLEAEHRKTIASVLRRTRGKRLMSKAKAISEAIGKLVRDNGYEVVPS